MAEPKWLVGRQPILDRTEQVAAYELLFRSSRTGPARIDHPALATARVMLGALSGIGAEEILGVHRGFINVDRELLFSEAIELLPRERSVIEILETVRPDPEVVARCRDLARGGFALALDDHRYEAAFSPLYDLVEIVKVDLVATPFDELAPTVLALRRYPPKLLAEKVEHPSEFRRCLDLGFDYFQGYYFARPDVMERRRIDETAATLLKLLRMLMEDADVGAVEEAFRESAGLTYKLLVLVNSVAFGSRERLRTVRQAITMLGRQQMRRWLQLALFASDSLAGLDDPLLEMAAVRAHFMEQLARRHPALRREGDAPEQAFVVGILSLLDAVYDVAMEKLVGALHLSDGVRAALVGRDGPLGELLAAVEAVERLEVDKAWQKLERLGIPQAQAIEAQWEAFAWKRR